MGTLEVINVARAESDPARSVVARVPAGCNPVRVTTSANGSVVWVTARASDALLAFSAVADSNRFSASGQHASLAVVDVQAALTGRPALLGYLPAGTFPRDVAANPAGGAVLVANNASSQVESVDVADLP